MAKIIINENQLNLLKATLGNMPLLNEVYTKTRNFSNPISINETNAKRLIDRHSANGYAIVSASRGPSDFGLGDSMADKETLLNINKSRTKEMISLIRSEGFSYTLSYGGFIENLGDENETNVYERSAIIYAEKTDGSVDPEGMKDLALKICGMFNQESVLVKMPDTPPQYLDRDGNVDMSFSGDISFNDAAQMYFTDLHKNTEKKMKDGSSPTRFTFMESYISPKPQCYSESHLRHLKGEIFLK